MNITPINSRRVGTDVDVDFTGFTAMELDGGTVIAASVLVNTPGETVTVTHSLTKAQATSLLHELADLIATH